MVKRGHIIAMKLDLNEKDYEDIKKLEEACYEKQKTNLKLELQFKEYQNENSIKNKIMTEFLFYENEVLVGYLGLGNYGGDIVEVTGMVHPGLRRRGIFKKLYLIAKEEWQKICPSEVLVLCDHTSTSGLAFINHIEAEYVSSEYKMHLNKNALGATNEGTVKLRVARSEDAAEINRQTSIYFGGSPKEVDDESSEIGTEESFIKIDDNFISYMAEIKGEVIGKIHISVTDNEGFIYGFGVLPSFRGVGYGREILCSALDILKEKSVDNIFLEVATKNNNALGLYESCGFEEISVMDYYVVS